MAESKQHQVDDKLSATIHQRSTVGHQSRDIRLWNHPRLARWAAWVVILLTAVLYLATLDTGLRPDELSGGDLITHQYAQVQARPSNAPGYPLYTMGGWFWFRLTRLLLGWVFNPVQLLASYSTLWALLSLFVLYRLILCATKKNWPLAALLTLFYASTYFFWFYSVTTEQYTMAIFQTLLLVWLAFRWDERERQGERSDYYLLGLAFVLGTCLANLVTTLFIGPPLLWFILRRRPDLLRRPKLIVQATGLALLPMISYAYVYARGAAHPEWRGEGEWSSAWAWFVTFLTTQQGRDELGPGLTLVRLFTDEFPALIWGELTWVVLIGGLVGLWYLGRRRATFIYGTLVIYLIFCWVDRFGNWYQVIMPAYPLIVLGLGAGLSALWSRDWVLPQRMKYVPNLLILLGLLTLIVYRFAVSLPRADQSHRSEDSGLDPGWTVLADQPVAYSIVVGEYDEWLALEYLTTIWKAGQPLDARPICQADHPQSISAIYLTRDAASADPKCLADQHRYAAGTTLIRVQAAPNTQLPKSARNSAFQFGPQLTLVGFEVHPSPETGPESRKERTTDNDYPRAELLWHLSLYWQANTTMDVNYTISVRPLRDGAPIFGEDGQPLIYDQQPVWNAYPTTQWSPGEVVRDDYILALPNQDTPNSAQIVVYRSYEGGFENLGEAILNLK